MGILDSILSDDLVTLTDTDFFGESALYTPVAAGGPAVPVQGLAVRMPIADNGGSAKTKWVEFTVSADAKVGIPVKPVKNRDTITIAWNIGDTPAAFLIVEIEEQDAGGWRLKLKLN